MTKKGRYDLLELAIIEKLDSIKQIGVEIIPKPDKDSERTEPFLKPRITVWYFGSEYSPDTRAGGIPKNNSTESTHQTEFAMISLIFDTKSLRGDKGIYSLKQKVDNLLLGFRPKPFGKIFFKSFEEIKHTENIWTFALTVVCDRILVESSDEELLANSNNVTLMESADGINAESIILQQNCEE